MGLLDKAKGKIENFTSSRGEEFVGSIEDEWEDERDIDTPARKKAPKATKPPKLPRDRKKFTFPSIQKPDKKPSQEPSLNASKTIREDVSKDKDITQIYLDDDLMGGQEEATERDISDILAILLIPDALKLPTTVMLPEDFRGQKFSKSTPVGYDVAQVDSFISQTRSSIETLIQLHDLRNEHIVKLAEYISVLHSEKASLIYEAELAEGLSVLPTQGRAEQELAQAQVTISRLTAELQRSKNAPPPSENEIAQYTDRISILERENEDLAWELKELKGKYIALQNDNDIPFDFAQTAPHLSSGSGIDLQELPDLPDASGLPELSNYQNMDDLGVSLPDDSTPDSNNSGLPDLDFLLGDD